MPDRLRFIACTCNGASSRPLLKGINMLNRIDEATDDKLDDYLDADDDDHSEIDGDCNESQPCRGDESWLPQDISDDIDFG
jgi:hypothetical protein